MLHVYIIYMWSNKGHIKWSFPFLLFLVFLREENIIYTKKKRSKHGNKGQTKWLPCLFYIIICLYFALIMYTITQCFYMHVQHSELNLVYIVNSSQVHTVNSTVVLQNCCNCYVQTINRMVPITTIYTCAYVFLQVHVWKFRRLNEMVAMNTIYANVHVCLWEHVQKVTLFLCTANI